MRLALDNNTKRQELPFIQKKFKANYRILRIKKSKNPMNKVATKKKISQKCSEGDLSEKLLAQDEQTQSDIKGRVTLKIQRVHTVR